MATTLSDKIDKFLREQSNTTGDKETIRALVSAFPATSWAEGTHIADASEAHALNATFSDTEVEAALDALGVIINAILVRLETMGDVATS